MVVLQHIIEQLKAVAPLHLAESWDNVGLLVGDPEIEIHRIMCCLTVTPEVVEEAVTEGVGLIVSHHPVLFKPTQRMTAENAEGRMILRLIHAGTAVYSPHTAYDNSSGGINDQLSDVLGLTNVRPLSPQITPKQFKLVVFVPENDLEGVSRAVFSAGAGVIGNYRECSFRSTGIGTYFGTDASHPTMGQRGRREQAEEYRLEVLCPQERLGDVTCALRIAHSYEEPAFDVYPLQPIPSCLGSGRIGELHPPCSAVEFARHVARGLGIPSVIVTGARERQELKNIAIACGAGGSLLRDAVNAGADAFLTGEIRFHDELAAQQAHVTVVAAGHYATERPGVERLAAILGSTYPNLNVWASRSEQNPARVLPG